MNITKVQAGKELGVTRGTLNYHLKKNNKVFEDFENLEEFSKFFNESRANSRCYDLTEQADAARMRVLQEEIKLLKQKIRREKIIKKEIEEKYVDRAEAQRETFEFLDKLKKQNLDYLKRKGYMHICGKMAEDFFANLKKEYLKKIEEVAENQINYEVLVGERLENNAKDKRTNRKRQSDGRFQKSSARKSRPAK